MGAINLISQKSVFFKFGTVLAYLLLCWQLVSVHQGIGMKYIIAIIKPFKLDEVREALGALGVAGMTVSEVKGFGRQKGQTEIYRGAEYSTNMLPKVKIEIAASDELAAQIVETIQFTAGSDSIGDGKIFVLDLVSSVRIRTGETGDNAL